MKKIVSLLCSISIISSMTSFAAAAENAVPVDIDEQAYAYFMKDYMDWNGDGVIDESELGKQYVISLDLEGVKDISWMPRLKECRYLTLKGGNITDFSVLKQMPKLVEVTFDNVPMTDISFIKEMNLKGCHLKNMDQISFEQRMEVAKFADIDLEYGYSAKIGVYPVGIFGEREFTYRFDNDELIERLDGVYDNYHTQIGVYAKKEGTTTCHAYMDGQEIFSCNLTVSPLNYISPPLNSKRKNTYSYRSFYYGDRYAVIEDGTLYGIKGGQYNKYFGDVKYISTTYKENADDDYVYIDLVMKKDGTLVLNDKVIDDIKFDYLLDGCAITKDGTLYSIYPDGEDPVLVKVGGKCQNLIIGDKYYIDENGELIWYFIDYDSSGKTRLSTRRTGIMNPQYMTYNYFLDDKGVLWKCSGYSYFSKTKVAEDVVDMGNYASSLGYRTELYMTSDGKWHDAYSKKEVVMYPDIACVDERSYVQDGCFYIHEYDSKYGDGGDLLIDWFITAEGILTIDLAGRHFAISDVRNVIGAEYDEEQEKGYAWFIRTDGSVWRYCFEDEEAVKMPSGEAVQEVVPYDLNGDNEFNIADVVTLQRWLLGYSDTHIVNRSEADINKDRRVDVFDLCELRKAIIAHN